MGQQIDLTEVIERTKNDPGVDIGKLKAGTNLVVSTQKSVYQIKIIDPETYQVEVIGGKHVTTKENGTFIGSTWGGSAIKLGWIGLDMRMEIQLFNRLLLTTTKVQKAKIIGDGWEYDVIE